MKSNKNDVNDDEAMSRPNMRFVLVKTAEQQNIQTMHQVRAELIERRTAKNNQIH